MSLYQFKRGLGPSILEGSNRYLLSWFGQGGFLKNQFETSLIRIARAAGAIMLCAGAIGCSKETNTAAAIAELIDCRGIYYLTDTQGNLKKFNEWYNKSADACYTESMSLSQWEKTSEAWKKKDIHCDPQPQFNSRSLVSANNFYQYRNGKSYLDLDSSTGIYRRLVIGEGKDSSQTFSRIQGCFYQRTGQGADATYGSQILLDTDIKKIKTSEHFDPMEIFSYTETATSIEMVRFDSSGDWDFKFCPELSTPWGYCDLLRNGNIFYYPVLTSAEMSSLLDEALLIRRQFNFKVISKSDFEFIWSNTEKTNIEIGRGDWKYMVNGLVDTPMFVDQAWKEYIKGLRPRMPDLSSPQISPICYKSKREVLLSNGTTAWLSGEVCYVDGNYVFTKIN